MTVLPRTPKKGCDDAGVSGKLPQAFISTADVGVEAFHGDITAESIKGYLSFRLNPVKGNRVTAFKGEDQIAKLKGSNRHIVLNFFSDNAASKRFAKHFEMSSSAFKSGGFISSKKKKKELKLAFVNVDCDKSEEFCEDYGVLSFPTIGILDANDEFKLKTIKKIKTHEKLTEHLKDVLQPYSKKNKAKPKKTPVSQRNNPEELFTEAVKLSEDGFHKEASVYFRRIVELAPNSNSHGNLATALMRIGNGPINYPSDFLEPYKESLKHYIISLQMDPTNDAALEGKKNCLGNIRHRSENAGISKKEIEAIIKSVLDGTSDSSDDWDSNDSDDDWGSDGSDDDWGDDWGDDNWGEDDSGKDKSSSSKKKKKESTADDDWGEDDWGDDDWGEESESDAKKPEKKEEKESSTEDDWGDDDWGDDDWGDSEEVPTDLHSEL